MIELIKVNKYYKKNCVLKDLSIKFPDAGLVSICGKSGCGKSTLLKIISLIDEDFDGIIKYLGKNIDELSKEEKRRLRSKDFGFIFQNFELFEDDTVFNNIVISLQIEDKKLINQRIDDYLEKFQLTEHKYTLVKNLSGGEKQRLAIIRAIINEPKILFCDEPTGSLDTKNSNMVFEILKSISSNILVICVTHDKRLAFKYSDNIYFLKNKQIDKIINLENKFNYKKIQTFKCKKISERKLNFNFMFNHSKSYVSSKKVRYRISQFLIGITLIIFSFTCILTTSLKSNLIDSFKSLIGDNSVVLKEENETQEIEVTSLDEATVDQIVKKYESDILYKGCSYFADFENYFIDQNQTYLIGVNPQVLISDLTIRNFNEFYYIDDFSKYELMPSYTKNLAFDEIILGLNFTQVKKICFALKIERSYESLAKYIESNDLKFCIYLANSNWNYDDEQIFVVRSIIPDTSSKIYHTNPMFNKILLEDSMRFPSSLNLKEKDKMPWVMKKIFYIKTKEFQTSFLNKIMYDEEFSNVIFDNDSQTYNPISCPNDNFYTNKLFAYKSLVSFLHPSLNKIANKIDSKFKFSYFSTNFGYVNYGTSIFSGFSSDVFLTPYLTSINEYIDKCSKIKIEEESDIELPYGIVKGNAFQKSDNLKIEFNSTKSIEGDYPTKINEIAISRGLFEKFGLDTYKEINLYITLNKEKTYSSEYIFNKFKTMEIKLTGVVEDNGYYIYHDSDYSISLFRDLFKVSPFNLIPNGFVYELENELDEVSLNKINSLIDGYKFLNPMIDIRKTINEILQYLTIILLIFSFATLLSCFLVLIIVAYIDGYEKIKDYRIFHLLGIKTKEILKLICFESVYEILSPFIISIFLTIFISSLTSYVISLSMNTIFVFSFPSIALISLLLITVFIIFFNSFIKYLFSKNRVM